MHTRKMIIALIALPTALFAQDAPAPEPARETAADAANLALSTALRGLTNTDELVATVEVKEQKAEQKGGIGGAGGAVMIASSSSSMGQPFEGRAEAWRGADGTLVILSQQELPGFALYLSDSRFLKQETFEEERFTVDQIKAELAPLMDPSRLARKLLDAKLKPEKDALTGGWVFRGPVAKSIVKKMGGGMRGFMAKRVVGAEAMVVVGPEGKLVKAEVTVKHNDPMQAMIGKRMGGIRIQMGAGGPVPVPVEPDDDEEDDEHDKVTGSTVYTLQFGRGGPSARAKAFKEKMAKLAGE